MASWRPRTIRGRVALWTSLATALGLLVFAAAAYVVFTLGENDDAGEDADESAEVRNRVLTALAVAAPLGLLLATGGALWLTRRALAPLAAVVRDAGGIDSETLDARFVLPAGADELRALVVTLNRLLDRLEQGYLAQSSFAAAASHELRTPLAVVGNELEVALRRPREAADWEVIARTSLDELRRLGRLVDSLLRMARVDSLPLHRQRLEAAGIVDLVLAGQAAAAKQAGVELSADLGAAAWIDGDADALVSALGNVVANAIRLTPAGGTVSLTVAAGDRVSFTVDDTGPGIDPEAVELIFTPFVRDREAQAGAPNPHGAGLGLTIARRIVGRHGGQIRAENRAGGGARFVIELPARAG